jgi:DNA-binding Lrp family transcriptional regulator
MSPRDAPASLGGIADVIGTPAPAVTPAVRIRTLRERGVITGARLEVDLAKIGRPVQALVAVRVRPPTRASIEGFREWAAGLPEVAGLFVTSGTEDFLIHIAVPTNEHMHAFVIDRLTEC